MTEKTVYADCAASAPVLQRAKDAVYMDFGNPNSVHRDGRIARGFLENARETVARCIGADPSQVAFTPSATAACRFALRKLNVRYCSPFEHKAVAEAPTICGNDFLDSPYAHMLANNETGQVFVREVQALAENYKLFTDATAAVGQIPVNVDELGVEALAAGGHKFGAPAGIGFVYLRSGVKDEEAFPGTPPVGLAYALANALEFRADYIVENAEKMLRRRTMLIEKLTRIPGAHINCINRLRLPNIVSVRFDGVNARELLTLLDVNGVYASAGAACTADMDTPSPALLASGLTPEQALSTIRLSFCPEHTDDDYIFVSEAVSRCVRQLLSLAK